MEDDTATIEKIDEETATGLEDDAFELAFEAAANDEELPAEETTGEETTGEETTGEETTGEETTGEETTGEETTGEETTGEAESDVDKAARIAAEQVATNQAATKQMEADKAVADKKIADDQAEVDKKAAEALAEEQPTTEEQATLDAAAGDFPLVAEAQKVHERVLLSKFNNMLNRAVSHITNQLDQRMAPLTSTVQTVANNSHEAAILKAHPDAFDMHSQIVEWVDGKPDILKTALSTTLNGGSAEQVNQLITMFKDETGLSQTQTPEQLADEQAAKDKAAKAKKDKEDKLLAQEGVLGRNTTERAGVDPDDFDGAFEKFANEA